MNELADLVRKSDPLRYRAALYAPEEKRGALLALHAFNVESARIRDVVTEPLAGEMRLRWWRDVLDAKSPTETAGHPVAEALKAAIAEHDLPTAALDNLLEARRLELYSDPLPSRADLEGYCGDTAGALIQLSSLILSPENAVKAGSAAGHAGCALGIAGILALLPSIRARGQCFIPVDILAAAGATVDDVLAPEPAEPADRALSAMIALGRDHVSSFERLAVKLPAVLRPAYLPAAISSAWFDALERAGRDVFTQAVAPAALTQSWIAFRRAMFGWR